MNLIVIVYTPYVKSTTVTLRKKRYKMELISKAQFIRRASAVPNLINIGFDRSTAQARLQFRRRVRVELNSVFAQ